MINKVAEPPFFYKTTYSFLLFQKNSCNGYIMSLTNTFITSINIIWKIIGNTKLPVT